MITRRGFSVAFIQSIKATMCLSYDFLSFFDACIKIFIRKFITSPNINSRWLFR